MSFIVKGMDIPKNCLECSYSIERENICSITGGGCDWNYKRSPHCPLIEIPTPHGRLIDAEDVKKKWEPVSDSLGTLAITECYFGSEWADELVDVPTILEAEN